MFDKYKQMLRRYRGMEMSEAHCRALLSISRSDARGYFRHCKVPGVLGHEPVEEEAATAVHYLTAAAAASVVSLVAAATGVAA